MSRWAYHMARETIRGIESMRRAREADERRAVHEAMRAQRDAERQALRDYQGARQCEADEQTRTAGEQIEAIRSMLSAHPIMSCRSWRELSRLDDLVLPPFVPPERLANASRPPSAHEFVGAVRAPHALLSWLPFVRRRYEHQLVVARERHARAVAGQREAESRRQDSLRVLRDRHDTAIRTIKAMQIAYQSTADATHVRAISGDATALADLLGVALSPTEWLLRTESFPFCVPSVDFTTREVVVDVDVSDPADVVPGGTRFRYVKKSDEIRAVATSDRAMQMAYRDYLAGALLTVAHATLVTCDGSVIEAVTCNAQESRDDGICRASVRVEAGRWRTVGFGGEDAWASFRDLRGWMPSKPANGGDVRPLSRATDRASTPTNELRDARDALLAAIHELRKGQRAARGPQQDLNALD